jgi:hypothetical protein
MLQCGLRLCFNIIRILEETLVSKRKNSLARLYLPNFPSGPHLVFHKNTRIGEFPKMSRKRFWWPGRIGQQLVLIENFSQKIPVYAPQLPLTPAQVDKLLELCEAIRGSITFVEESRTAMQSSTQWRDNTLLGEQIGTPAGPAPAFPVLGDPGYETGSLRQFFRYRDLIMALPGYTEAIGKDLMLIGAEPAPASELDIAPEISVRPLGSDLVNISGSMQGNSVLKVEYMPDGGDWREIGIVTNLPVKLEVDRDDPRTPERGWFRAIFYNKNRTVGTYSPDYPVVVS